MQLLKGFLTSCHFFFPSRPRSSTFAQQQRAGIAIPLSALAAAEGMPPLLTHTSVVLHNWHRLDPSGPIRTENLASNCQFLGGLDETWFYIATVEIEARGGGILGALVEVRLPGAQRARSACKKYSFAHPVWC